MFGVIFQDFGKYAFTVNENISFGEITKQMDLSAIQEATKASAAEEFILHLPDAYDTPLMRVFDENGIEPSIKRHHSDPNSCSGKWQIDRNRNACGVDEKRRCLLRTLLCTGKQVHKRAG